MLPQIRGFANGIRTRNTRLASGGSLTVSNHPFGLVAITCNVRPIEIGQEAGICTRTVSFTGRDAAGYTTILMGIFDSRLTIYAVTGETRCS